MPVDGIDAVVRQIRDLGTSRWQLSNHATSGHRNTEVPLRSAIGTFETDAPILRMSVRRGTPEVAVVRPKRRG